MKQHILTSGIFAALAISSNQLFYGKPDEGAGASGNAATGEGSPVTNVNPFSSTHEVVDTISIEIKKLVLDAGTQPRVAINDETVKEYTEVIKAAIKSEQPIPFPAITVFRDPTGRCIPADGFHRIAAHKGAHVKEILCEIREGTDRDALLFSCGANATHGERRTNKDKARAVKTVLSDESWVQLPNNEIARLCGVSEWLVRDLRSVAKSPAVRKIVDKKTGKVKTMDVSAIGKGKGGGKKGAKAAAKKTGKGKGKADATDSSKPSKAAADGAAELDKALIKIAKEVGGTEGGKIRSAVLDGTLELSAREVRDWAAFAPKYIKAVAPLVTGGARLKPTKAFDFLQSELSEKIVTELHNRAIGGGGEYTYEADGVKIVVTSKGK